MSDEMRIDLYRNFEQINSIPTNLYDKYNVKRGLRNADGSGVVAGITNISNVHGYVISDGDKVPDEGVLTYRGYNVYDLLQKAPLDGRFAFEEITYLLLMGNLPTEEDTYHKISLLEGM